MCGIVGYIGKQKAERILVNGLLNLEYRGYDSAGMATLEDGIIKVVKTKGRVKNLYEISQKENLEGTIGIAHTRWATHGKPSDENSHPHLDNTGTFSVVHNGIIENYAEIREMLIDNGVKFLSQTDTEVIPNLINYFYKNEKDFLKAVSKACKELKGSYALGILCKDEPDKIIVTRKDSPLVIGCGENEFYISSDTPAYLDKTKDFYFLDDNDFAIITKDNIEFLNSNLESISKNVKKIEWSTDSAQKNGYEDFMLKEIYEQSDTIKKTISAPLSSDKIKIEGIDLSKEFLSSINKIYIVACGTAMHAGLATKKIFEDFCRIQTEVDLASEFRYRDPLIDSKSLCIYISQSGETADTIAALKLAKEKGATTLAVTNVVGSSITREADYSIYTMAGPEIAVASTKAYTAQVSLLAVLALYFSEVLGGNSECIKKLKEDIKALPEKVSEVLNLNDEIKVLADEMYNEKDVFFIGRGVDYTTSLEGSLKLKEISYIHSDAYASGELKHGPIALIEEGIFVISPITDGNLSQKAISNIQEVITRGAKAIVITNQDIPTNNLYKIINIPETSSYISSILSVIPLQLLAYYITKKKGLDVDKPRNLAKSVTVE